MKKAPLDTLNKNSTFDISNFYVAGIGASAGGHQAIFDFFENIPANPQMAFIVIMHLNRNFESKLNLILSKHTSLKVIKLKGFEILMPNTIYVLPENNYVEIHNRQFFLTKRLLKNVQNTAIDIFFESLAKDIKSNSIGIIFSGMGTDGSKGIKKIDEEGGIVLVQDPTTAQFDSMPLSAIHIDHPDYISSPGDIGKNLMNIISYKNNLKGIIEQ